MTVLLGAMRKLRGRVSRIGDWFAARPVTTCLMVVTVVVSVGYGADEQNDDEVAALAAKTTEIAECAQDYVEASNAANAPIREAAAQLDAADDRVWHAAQIVFSQQAAAEDFLELRLAIADRNRLSDELAEEREEHPPPESPETFCAER